MPGNETFLALLDTLLQRTRNGKLTWSDTADENVFRLVMENGMIRVERDPSVSEDLDEAPDTLLVLNRENKVVDRFVPKNRETSEKLSRLWEMARRSARNADQVLANLLQEIKASGDAE
jgi:hypothetical protein